jgi:hypothetical protein
MNIALVLQHKLLLGLQRVMQMGARPLAPAPVSARPQAAYLGRAATRGSGTGVSSRQLAHKVMPLRVLRVVESGMPRSSTGRLVISGRMADVCAELDRLVEREAALH